MRHPQNEYRIKKEDHAMTMKLGIQTMTPDEVARLKAIWGE